MDELVEGGEAPEVGLPEAVRSMLERQPFRGYELREVLSCDDRGAVFKGYDSTMDRAVAVKVMRPWQGRDGVVEEFFSLAGSIASLRCSGVARGLDAGRGDGSFFLVYEYLSGESLRARLKRRVTGRLTEKESLAFVGEVARVLRKLFEMGHSHGNFHPGNIIFGSEGRVGLAGIGFAWNLAFPDEAAACRSRAGYISPERIEDELGVDVRGDLYGLGAAWFEALVGRPVFEGDPDEVLRKQVEERAPSVRKLDEKISEATAALIAALLERDRNKRPRTPKEFLKRLLQHPLLAGDGDTKAEEGDAEEIEETEGDSSAEENRYPEAMDNEKPSAPPVQISSAPETSESETVQEEL